MNIHEIRDILLYTLAINYTILLLWVAISVFAHDWLYRLSTRWFRLSVETFDALNYGGMSFYKACTLLFNAAPLAALYLAT